MILNIKLEFNPETQECKVVKTEIEKVKEPVKILESSEPQITLEPSKYTLNPAAAELMGISVGTRIDIKYQMVDGVEYPVIGTEASFGSGGGNKLTKSLTVSYRGKANDRLSRFGDVFTVTPMRNSPGLFVLIGNGKPEQIPDEIEIIEDMTNNEDLTDLDNEPLSFDDDFTSLEDATLIEEDALSFE